MIDATKTKKLYKKLLNRDSYTRAQFSNVKESSEKEDSSSDKSKKNSKKLSIQLLNASGITGLAASVKTKLEADGFTGLLEPGNYTTENLTHTKIIVKKKSVGKDLLTYFKNAEIEVGTVSTKGADIEILIGSEDGSQVAGY